MFSIVLDVLTLPNPHFFKYTLIDLKKRAANYLTYIADLPNQDPLPSKDLIKVCIVT